MTTEQRVLYDVCFARMLEDRKINHLTIIQHALRISLAIQNIKEYQELKTGLSSKEKEIIRLVSEDYLGEKIIIYSSSVRWINRFIPILAEKVFNGDSSSIVRITGEEDSAELRKEIVDKFNSDPNIKITSQGHNGIIRRIISAIVGIQVIPLDTLQISHVTDDIVVVSVHPERGSAHLLTQAEERFVLTALAL